MNRTTLMLPDELRLRAFAEARRRGISFGELVRKAVRELLERPRAKTLRKDSLLSDRVLYDGPVPADSSTRLDDYLYGDKP